jgi:hypothetical protein
MFGEHLLDMGDWFNFEVYVLIAIVECWMIDKGKLVDEASN